MRYLAPILVALASGCDNARLSGEVNGENVGGARDAFYDTVEIDIPLLGTYRTLVVMVTEFPDGCTVFDDLFDAVKIGDCSATCDAVVSKAEEHGLNRDSYWSSVFTVNASDAVNADFAYDPDLQPGDFTMTFSSWNSASYHDTTSCRSTCEDGNLFVSDDTDASAGTLSLQQDGDVISGKFDVDLSDGGQLGGAFAARSCDMGAWLDL